MHDLPVFVPVVCGMVWMLANLWCLNRALRVWLAGSLHRWSAAGWFLVKFPLLYGAAFFLLTRPGMSPVGFGAGVTAAMVVVITVMVARSVNTPVRT